MSCLHRRRLFANVLMIVFLCATCQAAPYNQIWATYPPLITTPTSPASCSSTEFSKASSGGPEIECTVYYKQCFGHNRACCPRGYRQVPATAIQPLLAPGACPDGYDPAKYQHSSSRGEIVKCCCPRPLTISTTRPNIVLCVSTGSSIPIAEVTPSALPLVVAVPSFIIARRDIEASSASASTSIAFAQQTEGAANGRSPHDVGLKIGISLAVIVPVIAVMAFLCRVFIIIPKQRLVYIESGNFELPASPRRRVSRTTAARNRCNDDDSILDSPPPYLANEAETPPPGIDAPIVGRTDATATSPSYTPNMDTSPGDIHDHGQGNHTADIRQTAS